MLFYCAPIRIYLQKAGFLHFPINSSGIGFSSDIEKKHRRNKGNIIKVLTCS